jgi:hypothetical protein
VRTDILALAPWPQECAQKFWLLRPWRKSEYKRFGLCGSGAGAIIVALALASVVKQSFVECVKPDGFAVSPAGGINGSAPYVSV